MGRPPIGTTAQSNAERQRKSRDSRASQLRSYRAALEAIARAATVDQAQALAREALQGDGGGRRAAGE